MSLFLTHVRLTGIKDWHWLKHLKKLGWWRPEKYSMCGFQMWFLLSRHWSSQNFVTLSYLTANAAGKWIRAVCPGRKNWVNNQPHSAMGSPNHYILFFFLIWSNTATYFLRRKPQLHLLRCMGPGFPHKALFFLCIQIWRMLWQSRKTRTRPRPFPPVHPIRTNKQQKLTIKEKQWKHTIFSRHTN